MIKSQIRERFKKVVDQLISLGMLSHGSRAMVDEMTLQRTKEQHHGDYASNLALLMAKAEKKSPRQVADTISNALLRDKDFFAQIEVAGPGFINLTLADPALAQIISHIADRGEDYGRAMKKNGQRVLIEFISANPTGGLHLGHARGAIVGDALARILTAAGFEVIKEYYVNDVGNQIETLARTIHKRYRELFGESIAIAPGEYPGKGVIDIARALKDSVGEKWLGVVEEEWLEPISQFGVKYNLSLIEDSLHGLGIKIDTWFFESHLHEDGSLQELVDEYSSRGMLYEGRSAAGADDKIRRERSKAAQFSHLQEGGIFLRTTAYGDDEDRIIKRRDGRFVYLTADLAYHHLKFKRHFDLMIDVFGADHAGHVARIRAGMAALGHAIDRLRFVIVQMVRLVREGKEVRFSKRAGEVIGLDDLVDEVGRDAARFVFLMRSANAQFDLDLDLLTKSTNDNPVFYVQYGHARMATLLKKAKDEGIEVNPGRFSLDLQQRLVLKEEKDLLLRISELDEVVLDCANSLEPHRLIYFCQDLIKAFHSYFTKYRHSERIISDDSQKTQARLSLVFAVKRSIGNALDLLGVAAPDYMEQAQPDDEE